MIVSTKRKVKMSKESIKDLIESLIETSKKNSFFEDFANVNKLNDFTCKQTTGLTKDEFIIPQGYSGCNKS
ncbi:unnamed protein product, partial [Brachionus calyciflorus]